MRKLEVYAGVGVVLLYYKVCQTSVCIESHLGEKQPKEKNSYSFNIIIN